MYIIYLTFHLFVRVNLFCQILNKVFSITTVAVVVKTLYSQNPNVLCVPYTKNTKVEPLI